MRTLFFESLLPSTMYVRHFSLARHALVAAFRLLGLQAGDKVLLPEYICRDVLASLNLSDLQVVWYGVDTNLEPTLDSVEWPVAKAVLAVNYFGFPQNLAPFDQYAARTGAIIIEDNAHGFLSRDEEGHLLGARRLLGLFSYRKTLLLGRGAGLTINKVMSPVSEQLSFSSQPVPLAIRIRCYLRNWFGTRTCEYLLAKYLRGIRKLLGRTDIPAPAADAESAIPGLPNPDEFLITALDDPTILKEVERRRSLYKKLSNRAIELGLKLVYPQLPAETVPYGLPVFTDDLCVLAKLAQQERLDFIKWPDLPESKLAKIPKHYGNIYLINFL